MFNIVPQLFTLMFLIATIDSYQTHNKKMNFNYCNTLFYVPETHQRVRNSPSAGDVLLNVAGALLALTKAKNELFSRFKLADVCVRVKTSVTLLAPFTDSGHDGNVRDCRFR